MAIGDSGQLVASVDGPAILLWDLRDPGVPRRIEKLAGNRGEAWSLALSRNGRWLASGDAYGTTNLYLLGEHFSPDLPSDRAD
ncbi:hypothetical protein [Frankia tisae]|uniref:hypothetical protein n=1 Tax=Frankia tisae TaxID=2950104 RepID=UPI0021C0606F|nr:hypothetical protein [Frankia tisae]